MHSKFLKIQTVFLTLAVLFTSVLVPNQVQALESGSASNAAQAAAITDPNTFDAWYKIQGNNTSAIGRIWADKTVDADPIQFTTGPLKGQSIEKSAGSDFLVALSAMSSTSSTTQTEPIPLDVVMVLDASGSMSDPMSRTDATKRIDALKDAVLKFIGNTADKNAQISDESKKIRLSIVKFAGDTNKNTGNQKYRGQNGYTYNYSQIMQNLTVCEGSGATQLTAAVNAIDPAGATQADLWPGARPGCTDQGPQQCEEGRHLLYGRLPYLVQRVRVGGCFLRHRNSQNHKGGGHRSVYRRHFWRCQPLRRRFQ